MAMKCILHCCAGVMPMWHIALWILLHTGSLFCIAWYSYFYVSEPIPGRLNLDEHVQMLMVRGIAS